MKKLKYRFSILTIMVLVVSSCSIKEGLTDEEVLALDKGDWNYSIQLFDPVSNSGVEGATVQVTIDGELKTFTSNSLGSVDFSGPYNEEIFATISKDGYYGFSREIYLNEGDRGKGLYRQIYMLPSGDEGTFTIKGKITVQSDLTTEAKEAADGATFTIDLFPNYDYMTTITVKTDATGNYSVKMPVWDGNTFYGYFRIRYNDYVAPQMVAINGLSGDPAFPETLPTVPSITTTFSAINSGSVDIPYVQPIYATVPASTGVGGIQAAPFRLTPNGSGGVSTGISAISTGTAYSAGDKPLTIVSIVGGTGALGVIRDTDANGILDQYEITAAGNGYPINNWSNQVVGNENFTNSYPSFYNDSYNYPSNNYKAGSIVVNNIYFGTGVSRVQEVQ